MSAVPAETPNASSRYSVTSRDLPLCCPMPSMSLWNSHPRVYLPIEQAGWAKCGYCGAEYTLVETIDTPAPGAPPGDAAVQR